MFLAAGLQVKEDAEKAYLAALSKPYLATPLARILDALEVFAQLYPRPAGVRRPVGDDERLEREQRDRWPGDLGAASIAPRQQPQPPPPPPPSNVADVDYSYYNSYYWGR